MNLEYALVGDMSWQTQADWQTPDTPFMSFAFWQALSDTGAIGEKKPAGYRSISWFMMVISTGPVAVMPVFVKGHHQGEFVFYDFWAQAYAHYGLDYYPRLVTSVPYTPITGQRLWLAANQGLTPEIIQTVIKGVDDVGAAGRGALAGIAYLVESQLATITASSSQEI